MPAPHDSAIRKSLHRPIPLASDTAIAGAGSAETAIPETVIAGPKRSSQLFSPLPWPARNRTRPCPCGQGAARKRQNRNPFSKATGSPGQRRAFSWLSRVISSAARLIWRGKLERSTRSSGV